MLCLAILVLLIGTATESDLAAVIAVLVDHVDGLPGVICSLRDWAAFDEFQPAQQYASDAIATPAERYRDGLLMAVLLDHVSGE